MAYPADYNSLALDRSDRKAPLDARGFSIKGIALAHSSQKHNL